MGRKVYKDEWKLLMNNAIANGKVGDIKFLWEQLDTIEEVGYFVLPF
jgi:hypothetical protein